MFTPVGSTSVDFGPSMWPFMSCLDVVGCRALEPAAGLELNALGLERKPLAGLLVLVIHADLVDAGRERGGFDLFLGVEGEPGSTGLHRRDDLLRDARILERDE